MSDLSELLLAMLIGLISYPLRLLFDIAGFLGFSPS